MTMDDKKAARPAISETERRKRQEAVDFARASVGLEGFKPSPECEAQAVRFINGEIEIAEVIATINEGAQRLR